MPVGQWGGYIGESWVRDLEAGARGLRVAFMREGGVAGAEFDTLLEGLVEEYKKMRGGLNIYVVVARKGEGEEKGKGDGSGDGSGGGAEGRAGETIV